MPKAIWAASLILTISGALSGALSLAHARVKPQVIYGVDNRVDYYRESSASIRKLADSTVALIRASSLTTNGSVTDIATIAYGQGMGLCTDEPFYAQETAAFCSGFLVTPDTIVTAGHCINNQASCDSTRFVFGFKIKGANSFPHSVPSDHVFKCKSVVYSISVLDGEDFAVVKLDRPVSQVQPLGLRGGGSASVGDGLMVIGYPMGLPVKIAAGANVRATQREFLVANLDTYGGNSGSAVLSTQTGLVEGVLVRGEQDFVYKNNCRTSNRCSDYGCRGEDVTLIERVLPYLQ